MTKPKFVVLVGGTLATLMILVAAIWLGPSMHRGTSHEIITYNNNVTSIPPSFLGHPLAYGAAVFGQLLVFSFACAVMFLFISAINIDRDSVFRHKKRTWRSPVNIFRLIIMFLMASVLCGVAPNLVTYLAWGEVSGSTMTKIFAVEKTFKALACVPFLAGVFLLVENDEIITMQLAVNKIIPEPLWPIQPTVREHSWTVFWIFLLAAGVTFAKWSTVAV